MSRRLLVVIVTAAVALGPIDLPGGGPVPTVAAAGGSWAIQVQGGVLASAQLASNPPTAQVTVVIGNETRLSTGSSTLDALLDYTGISSGYTLSVYGDPVGDVQSDCISVWCTVTTEPAYLLPGHRLEFELSGGATRGGVTFRAVADDRALAMDVLLIAAAIALRAADSAGCSGEAAGSLLDLVTEDPAALGALLTYPAIVDLANAIHDPESNPITLTTAYLDLLGDRGFLLQMTKVALAYGLFDLSACLARAVASPFFRALYLIQAGFLSAEIGVWFGLRFGEQLINPQDGTIITASYFVGTPPGAEFIASATTVTAGTLITFTDASTNQPSSWSWDFGDGSTSTEQNPTKTYTAPGAYTVALTATNADGFDTETKIDYVTIEPPPPTPTPAPEPLVSVALVARTFEDTATFRFSGPTDVKRRFTDGSYAWEEITEKQAVAKCRDLRPAATVKLKPGRYTVDVGEYDGKRMRVTLNLASAAGNRICVLGVAHEAFGEFARFVIYGRSGAFKVEEFVRCVDLCP